MDRTSQASTRQADVKKCVRLALSQLNAEPAFTELLFNFLTRPGRLLGNGRGLWPRFVTSTSNALGAAGNIPIWPAVAVEFSATAIDVADDFADGDISSATEVQRSPNAGLALGWLAQYAVAQASATLGAGRAARVGALLATGSFACCAGQDMDILLERDPEVTENRALFVSSRKAGALVSMAAAVGAACASDDVRTIELAGTFGAHVGVIAQLINDIAGIPHGSVPGSTDIAQKKKTLPIAYAIACAREEDIRSILDWYTGPPTVISPDLNAIAADIVRLGGLHYTWMVAKHHKRKAIEALSALEDSTGRSEVRNLRKLIPSVSEA